MVFVLHYLYTVAVVSPYNAAYVAAVKAAFANGSRDYRGDSRVWLFDMEHEAKVLELVNRHFSNAVVRHFIDMEQVIPA